MPPSLARGEGSREAPGAEDGEAVVVLRTRQGSQENHQGHHQDHHQDHHERGYQPLPSPGLSRPPQLPLQASQGLSSSLGSNGKKKQYDYTDPCASKTVQDRIQPRFSQNLLDGGLEPATVTRNFLGLRPRCTKYYLYFGFCEFLNLKKVVRELFPTEAACYLRTGATTGAFNRSNYPCTLYNSLFNQKYFLVRWIGWFVLIGGSIVGLIYRFTRIGINQAEEAVEERENEEDKDETKEDKDIGDSDEEEE